LIFNTLFSVLAGDLGGFVAKFLFGDIGAFGFDSGLFLLVFFLDLPRFCGEGDLNCLLSLHSKKFLTIYHSEQQSALSIAYLLHILHVRIIDYILKKEKNKKIFASNKFVKTQCYYNVHT